MLRRCKPAGMPLQEARQILIVHDNGESPCTHVGRLLSENLLGQATEGRPTAHDTATVCWILEADVAENAAPR